MSEQRSLIAVDALDQAISLRYPDASNGQVEVFRNGVIDYIAENLAQGYDIALVKREEDQTVLRILKFIEEDADQ